MNPRIASCVLLLTLATSGWAQVYKVVGPDGKVSYTDRPPSEANANVQLLRSGVVAPVGVAAAPAPVAPTTEAPARGAPKAAIKHARSAAVDIGTAAEPSASDPSAAARRLLASASEKARLLPALRVVLGRTALVEGAMALCEDTLPTSMRRYQKTETGWKQRNDQVLATANKVLDTTFAEERALLNANVKASADLMLQPVRNADASRRIVWCDRTVGEINSDAFELARQPSVAPLLHPAAGTQ